MTGPTATECYCGTCASCSGSGKGTLPDTLRYRHAAIRERLLAEIGVAKLDMARQLAALGTRDPADPSIALLDAYAGALHVLAVNTQRLAEDGTISRSEDRDAVVELVRLLGYEPRPALSATTTLAFQVDTLPGSARTVTVPTGTKIASVPLKEELPQIFETSTELEAHADWNRIKAAVALRAPPVLADTASVTVAGASSPVRPGDRILVPITAKAGDPPKWLSAQVNKVDRRADLDPVRTTIELVNGRSIPALAETAADAAGKLIVLGQRSAAFGANAPDLKLMSAEVRGSQLETAALGALMAASTVALPIEWRNLEMRVEAGLDDYVDLDAVYAEALAGRMVLFTRGSTTTGVAQAGLITDSLERSRADYGLSTRVTRIRVKGIDLSDDVPGAGFRKYVRESAIYIETAREPLLRLPVDEAVPAPSEPDRIRFEGSFDLPAGRRVILIGDPAGKSGGEGSVSQVATVRQTLPAQPDAAAGIGAGTVVLFDRNIEGSYRSTTLRLLGNAASASHGETPARGAQLIGSGAAASESAEPIGSGDAARENPRFQLPGFPLTYVPAQTSRGFAPALEVRVDDRLYQEQPSIFELGAGDRAYTIRSRAGQNEVQFAGRLPSGNYNVTALYRLGAGQAGNLAAGRLTTIMTPVLGITAAEQPVPAEGGSEAESIDQLRTAGPNSVRTLERVVSLDDYAAYARTYRGIGKALATELRVGLRLLVCVTVATTELRSPSPGSDTVEQLRSAFAAVSPPGRIVTIEGFTDLPVELTVALRIDPAFRRSDVEAKVRTALATVFGRATRQFGEALHGSAVIAAAQRVDGVIGAKLESFTAAGNPAEPDGRLLCPIPEIVNGALVRAGLLSIDPDNIHFAEMQS